MAKIEILEKFEQADFHNSVLEEQEFLEDMEAVGLELICVLQQKVVNDIKTGVMMPGHLTKYRYYFRRKE